jgi:hypothetical protein
MVQDRQDRNGQTDKRASTKNSRSSLKVLNKKREWSEQKIPSFSHEQRWRQRL